MGFRVLHERTRVADLVLTVFMVAVYLVDGYILIHHQSPSPLMPSKHPEALNTNLFSLPHQPTEPPRLSNLLHSEQTVIGVGMSKLLGSDTFLTVRIVLAYLILSPILSF